MRAAVARAVDGSGDTSVDLAIERELLRARRIGGKEEDCVAGLERH